MASTWWDAVEYRVQRHKKNTGGLRISAEVYSVLPLKLEGSPNAACMQGSGECTSNYAVRLPQK